MNAQFRRIAHFNEFVDQKSLFFQPERAFLSGFLFTEYARARLRTKLDAE